MKKAVSRIFFGLADSWPKDDEIRLIKEGAHGVILFSRNIENCTQLKELIRFLKSIDRVDAPPLIIAVDQEGGRVKRLRRGFEDMVSPMEMARRFTPKELTTKAFRWGNRLKELGFDLDFAPVVDLGDKSTDGIVGDRAFGSTEDTVIRYAEAFIMGMQKAGIKTCLKHFPGHGSIKKDSHTVLAHCHLSEQEIKRHIKPFLSLLDSGVSYIMTAHIIFDVIDPELPVTLSKSALGILKERLKNKDIMIISDDLEMHAISDHFSIEDIIKLGLDAGLDIFMFCSDLERIFLAVEWIERLS